jgi:hypothetical protein
MRNANSLALAACLALSACVLDWSDPDLDTDADTDDQVTTDNAPGDDVAGPCEGDQVAGACWTLAAAGVSCSSTCDGRGGYDDATSTIAGDSGTDANCSAVLDALGLPPGPIVVVADDVGGGCMWSAAAGHRYRIVVPATTAAAASADWQRACACGR